MVENHMREENQERPLHKAVERLERVEALLEHIRAEEARAENEIEKAVEEIEEVENTERHQFTIIVNGRPNLTVS
jgi:D-serine dehydratase